MRPAAGTAGRWPGPEIPGRCVTEIRIEGLPALLGRQQGEGCWPLPPAPGGEYSCRAPEGFAISREERGFAVICPLEGGKEPPHPRAALAKRQWVPLPSEILARELVGAQGCASVCPGEQQDAPSWLGGPRGCGTPPQPGKSSFSFPPRSRGRGMELAEARPQQQRFLLPREGQEVPAGEPGHGRETSSGALGWIRCK